MKIKINSVANDPHMEKIPFKLREIMRSRMEMNQPKKKKRKSDSEFQTNIPIPKFRRRKKESVRAYLNRMDQETKNVMFLTKIQANRKPEAEPENKFLNESIETKKSQKKKAFDRRRLEKILRKKEDKRKTLLENEIFQDKVKFGEVAMEPPVLSSKPRKGGSPTKAGEKQLLLKKLIGGRSSPVHPPAMSMARKRIIEEERERVVKAYRDLKKQNINQRNPPKPRHGGASGSKTKPS
ncbi:hypothetical protein GDO86_005012 [Hymenochirus boettgeri]|uniref:Coiled-coil domain-containing protein 137 n=1 Tax=Hymenochirus boettgeri TaxID=247094 RepID=A0A8T2J037_9PIPI|nr:hypothetical protein GDO86_005012 [Hymenochirus boettgeri]